MRHLLHHKKLLLLLFGEVVWVDLVNPLVVVFVSGSIDMLAIIVFIAILTVLLLTTLV